MIVCYYLSKKKKVSHIFFAIITIDLNGLVTPLDIGIIEIYFAY